jgi:hypothetical protein
MKIFFTLLTVFAFFFITCGNESSPGNENNNNSNKKTTLTITNLVTSLNNFEITYGDVIFKFYGTDRVSKEVNAGDNYLYINDLELTDYLKSMNLSGEVVYKTALLTCEKDKENQFVLMDNTVVTLLGNFSDSGEATDTIKKVRGIIFTYTGKEARGFNKIQTWFYDIIEVFNNAPDGTTQTVTITENFEFPGGGKYSSSNSWRTMFKEGKNKKIIIQGDNNVRTISNNGKTFTGYYQLEASECLFIVPNGITLELGNNIILNGNGADSPVIYVDDKATFIMNNGSTITGNSDSAVNSEGTFIMNGGTITGNNANDRWYGAGGVNIYGGTFTMNEGIIKNNTGYVAGGGVYVHDGSFIKTGGTIDNTNVADFGKVAYVANGYKRRETSAGPTDNLDSSIAGSAGGWE